MKEYEVLKTYRQYRGLTQKDVADSLGMTHSGYSKYERGERKITIEMWMRLMIILNIPSSALGNDESFLEQDLWISYDNRLYELAQDIIKNKSVMNDSELKNAKELFLNEFNNIQEEKKYILNHLKLDNLDEIIKMLKLEFLFKK